MTISRWSGRSLRRGAGLAGSVLTALLVAACGSSASTEAASITSADDVIRLMSDAGMCADGSESALTNNPIYGQVSSGNCGKLAIVVFGADWSWNTLFTEETCAASREAPSPDNPVAVVGERVLIAPDDEEPFTNPSPDEVAAVIPGSEVLTALDLADRYCG